MVYHSESQDHHVISAIKFFHSCDGQPTHYPDLSSFFEDDVIGSIDPRCTLMVQRGDLGLAIFNKANHWVDVPRCKMAWLSHGTYVELVHKFLVEVVENDGRRWVKCWGSGER